MAAAMVKWRDSADTPANNAFRHSQSKCALFRMLRKMFRDVVFAQTQLDLEFEVTSSHRHTYVD